MNIKLISLLLGYLLCIVIPLQAQNIEKSKFNSARFESELEQYITTEALLTPQESAAFFPIYKEMRRKQRNYIVEQHRFKHTDMTSEQQCKEVIETIGDNEIKQKELQKAYYIKFLSILPASKVLKIIKAETKFHRQAMHRFTRRNVKSINKANKR